MNLFQWSALPLVNNEDHHGYSYEVAVHTGMSRGAGTFSRVYFVLAGEMSTTPVRELDDGERNVSVQESTCLHYKILFYTIIFMLYDIL